MASTASGLLAGVNAARVVRGLAPVALPADTMIGALGRYISCESVTDFQPMKPNFGLLPPLSAAPSKRDRHRLLAERALESLRVFIRSVDLLPAGAEPGQG